MKVVVPVFKALNNMATPQSLNLPDQLKFFKHYLKIAEDHDKKNKVISYYCRFYVMQKAISMQLNAESKSYLLSLMDFMEKFKKENAEEAIHNELVGQAMVEDYALKVFLYADNEDRAARFNKAMVKSFFTAGLLFDTLTVFGPLSDDVLANQKYAKWKATYIHKCLQTGETPIAGPMGGEEPSSSTGPVGFEQYRVTPPSQPDLQPPPSTSGQQPPSTSKPSPTPRTKTPEPTAAIHTPWVPPPSSSGVELTADQYQSAIKSCNYAVSALRYEDVNTAVDYLTKALHLITTGRDKS